MNTTTIIAGDVRKTLTAMPSESVDCVEYIAMTEKRLGDKSAGLFSRVVVLRGPAVAITPLPL